CGWPMYRQPYGGSFRYVCGFYQQSHGAECHHNHVGGLLATQFLLSCIRQRLLASDVRVRLKAKLRALAEREMAPQTMDLALRAKEAALDDARTKRERAGRNLGLANGPEECAAVAAVFNQLRKEEDELETEVRRLHQTCGKGESDLDSEVAAALSGFDRMAEM